ncbi:hypothetical protein PAMA_004736 [Pampus argenteus]
MLLGAKNSGESLGSEGDARRSLLLLLFHINISDLPSNLRMESCMMKPEVKKKPKPPKPPPKPAEEMNVTTTRYSHRMRIQAEDTQNSRETEAPKDETDFKQTNTSTTGLFRRSQKEKTPSFTASREPSPDPRTDEAGSEKEQSAEKNKQEKNAEPKQENLNVHTELSASNDSLSENNSNKEKGAIFGGRFKKKPTEAAEEDRQSLHSNLSSSSDNLSENSKEKGGFFSGILRKSPKIPGEGTPGQVAESLQSELSASTDSMLENKEKQTQDDELSVGSEGPSEEITKEKGGIFSGIFKKTPKPAEAAQPEEEKGKLFSGLLKKTLKASGEKTDSVSGCAASTRLFQDGEAQKELLASSDGLSENNTTKELNGESRPSDSCENLFDTTVPKEKGGLFSGLLKKTPKASGEDEAAEDKDSQKELSASNDSLFENSNTKEKSIFSGIFKKTQKPAEETTAEEDTNTAEYKKLLTSCENLSEENTLKDPLSDSKEMSTSCDSLTENNKDDVSADELSASNDNLSEATKTSDTLPFIDECVELQDLNPAQESTVEVQPVEMAAYPTEGSALQSEQVGGSGTRRPISKRRIRKYAQPAKFNKYNVVLSSNDLSNACLCRAMEQAADRIYMGARLFVHLFNQRGASLQQVILELLALADAADQFHKKTVSAAVGGGVASVCGSVATITGLILAPFTFGASIIVTAVGIGVATAGSITSATANITDTVHSNMDRKKVEKMIQGYQEVIKDIRECLEFVQEGMDTLQEWDFEKFSQSAAKKALNHNIKHVMKEGGRAGKALMINTDKLISTVQVLGAAGGAAKAAQAISVTTGVMSALFLALDVFFLAKDSHELRKGAKTKFATKIRDVCKELQDGLLELNKVKTQLQKTMEGIEVEEYEEIEEVEVEVDDDLESDPKKLAELEQELDLLEERLDKKVQGEQKKSKENEKEGKSKKEKKQETSVKEKGEPEETKEEKEAGENDAKNESKKEKGGGEGKFELEVEKVPDEEKEQNVTSVKAVKPTKDDVVKEESHKGSKKDKETENRITAGKGPNKTTDEKQKEKEEAGKVQKDVTSRTDQSGNSERVRSDRESQRSKSSREEERGMSRKPEWREEKKEVESGGSTRSHSSRSDTDRPKKSKHEARESIKGSGSSSDTTESWRRGEEERGVKDWRAEMTRSREEKRENKDIRDSKRETERHPSHETASRRERSEREQRSGREESQSSHYRRERAEEKRGSRVESARRHFEKEGEEERGKRREDGGNQRRDREHEHSRRGSRPHSNALLEDGLYI